MSIDKSVKFNSPPVVAAVIVAAGLIVAAMVDAGRIVPQAAATQAPPPATAALSEASIRQQFVSQMNSEYNGATEMQFGKKQTYAGASVDKIQIATAGNEVEVDYELHWTSLKQNTGMVTATGCTLTKNEYGHFVNTYDLVTGKGAIKPQSDIQ